RSLDWLSVAATLSYFNERAICGELACTADHDHDRRSCLVETTCVELIDFAREGIQQVYESIKDTLPAGQEAEPAP
ncbi:MAG: hypothetical protein OXU37_08705, partial [Thaumarchaeota archaeon]|nr:hypothetical protein [Nitrososphaerota archaeon]